MLGPQASSRLVGSLLTRHLAQCGARSDKANSWGFSFVASSSPQIFPFSLVLPSRFLHSLFFFVFFPLHRLLKLLIGPNDLGTFLAHPVQSIQVHSFGETEAQPREETVPIAQQSVCHVPCSRVTKPTTSSLAFKPPAHNPCQPHLLSSSACSAAPRGQPRKVSWLEGRVCVQKIASHPQP